MSFPGRKDLEALGVIDPVMIEQFSSRVRDREDVEALICRRSGVIFLSSSNHIHNEYYSLKDHLEPLRVEGKCIVPQPLDDDHRRSVQFEEHVRQGDWLDFGAGTGALLDLLRAQARSAAAIEPNSSMRNAMSERGHVTYASIEALEVAKFDVVTMFHVLEHLDDPITTLRKIRSAMRPGARIIIEVPHAKDALLGVYGCNAFKTFTLWSEHLILHTQESLNAVLSAAGFSEIFINGIQRYPLSNHLYWLAKGLPGGQKKWPEFDEPALLENYKKLLIEKDATDTLLAIARTQ